ncbi:MAG: aminotransferase class I/II-fold pyridoxal phosphate-dependent enzyme [Bacteroidota bacterium]
MQIHHLPGRTLKIGQTEWLYFSGTAYLGLAVHPIFQEKVIEGIRKYGLNYGGSRRSNMQLAVFIETEEKLADWLDVEAVLTVSSGSLAGQLLIKYLEQDHHCHYSPSVHPALLGSGQIAKGTQSEWAEKIMDAAFLPSAQDVFLTSSLDPLHGQAYDFSWLEKLSVKGFTHLVVDDSHGLGVFGPDGTGIRGRLPQNDHIELTILSSMGKALGVPGGLIAGKKELIQQLWDSPFFGGASPIIPAYLHAFLESQDLIQAQRSQLQRNIDFFQKSIAEVSYFQQIPQHPVFYFDDDRLRSFLQKEHILVSSFHYPSAQDPLVNRIVINAAHTQADMEQLIDLILKYHHLQNT